MPYIKSKRRCELDPYSYDGGNAPTPQTCGELNYLFTEVIKRYLVIKQMNYQTINDIMGALEGCKMEFYARIARPYEETKIQENGDVYLPFDEGK